MTSIDHVILRELNPFDNTTFQTRNFWQEPQEQRLTVNSIHQNLINQVEENLDQVAKSHRPRTLLLGGDRGSGKSYLLKRLKQQLNSKAFFAYIGPWPVSDYIWRHILRQTVDSLMYVPEGQEESQLLLWLKGLSAFNDRGLIKKVLGERKLFISNLRASYPSGIDKAKEFFGVLYDLTNPELYPLACDWLRGENLDKEDRDALGVNNSIDNEDAAQKILTNFGRISADSQPIVLCFDQIDNIPRLSDDSIDLQPLFNVNSSIHTHYPHNFLIIISLITDTWNKNHKRIQPADIDRITDRIRLKPITLEEAEALWENRLYPLHQQVNPKPESPIYPLTRQAPEANFPGGRTYPRYALQLGRKLFLNYKAKLVGGGTIEPEPPSDDPQVSFQLLWHKEFKKTQQKITRIRQFASPELIQMLQEALAALQVKGIEHRLLTKTKYSNYSFSYQKPEQTERVGIVWSEEPDLRSFSYLMKACEKGLKQNLCTTLILIRAEKLGQSNNAGYKLFKRIFTGSPHFHITPHINSVHYLATYHSLVNAARAGDLVVGDRTPNLKDLQELTCQTQILHGCSLLQELGIVPKLKPNGNGEDVDLEIVKTFLLNLVKNQQFLGRKILIKNTHDKFPEVKDSQIEQLIEELCQEKKIQILDPNASREAQLVCLIPQS